MARVQLGKSIRSGFSLHFPGSVYYSIHMYRLPLRLRHHRYTTSNHPDRRLVRVTVLRWYSCAEYRTAGNGKLSDGAITLILRSLLPSPANVSYPYWPNHPNTSDQPQQWLSRSV